MPQISKQKQEKVQEQIVYFLFQSFPKQLFTSDIAKELARDEEFSFTLGKIKPLVSLVNDSDAQGDIYLNRIQALIGQLDDADVRLIVKSTLASRTEYISTNSAL